MSNSFTLAQLQRVSDIYAGYIGVRRVGLRIKTGINAAGRAILHPRKMLLAPMVLTWSRRKQIALIIHELCHFKTPKAGHSKRWKANVFLWASAFQMRYTRSDEALKIHMIKGCSGFSTYNRCDECKYKYPPIEGESNTPLIIPVDN